ncbi:MAG TPA: HEAT repeat domain-containing protein, partial [Elusimicrobiota bacterium]|nr:HEAT repeat domain-containing protein [Elusimicrobiota bacterium]
GDANQLRYAESPRDAREVKRLFWNPWGVWWLKGHSVIDPGMKLLNPDWPRVNRAAAQNQDAKQLAQRLRDAGDKPLVERVGEWLAIAGSFSMDPATPQAAMEKLYGMPAGDIHAVVERLSPDRFDEFIQIIPLLGAYGSAALPAIRAGLAHASGTRQAMLISLLASVSPSESADLASGRLNDPDWRVRRAALGVLGGWLDRELGKNPGRLRHLDLALDLARHGSRSRNVKEMQEKYQREFGETYLQDLFAILALDPDLRADDRLTVLRKSQSPVDPVSLDVLVQFAKVIARRHQVYARRISEELVWADKNRMGIRQNVEAMLRDPDPDVVQSAVTALGQIGDAEDAPLIAAFFNRNSARLREAAAAALAKMGEASRGVLEEKLRADEPSVRAMAALACAESTDDEALRKLIAAFRDSEESVRITALTGLCQTLAPAARLRERFDNELTQLMASDPSSSVRLLAGHVKTLEKSAAGGRSRPARRSDFR